MMISMLAIIVSADCLQLPNVPTTMSANGGRSSTRNDIQLWQQFTGTWNHIPCKMLPSGQKSTVSTSKQILFGHSSKLDHWPHLRVVRPPRRLSNAAKLEATLSRAGVSPPPRIRKAAATFPKARSRCRPCSRSPPSIRKAAATFPTSRGRCRPCSRSPTPMPTIGMAAAADRTCGSENRRRDRKPMSAAARPPLIGIGKKRKRMRPKEKPTSGEIYDSPIALK